MKSITELLFMDDDGQETYDIKSLEKYGLVDDDKEICYWLDWGLRKTEELKNEKY